MHNLYFKSLTLMFCLLTLICGADAQQLAPCGTEMGRSAWLRDFQTRIESTPRTGGVMYLPLQIHLVGTDNGTGFMSRDEVYQAFCTLNEDFVQADIQFFLANPINYIDNSTYYEHEFEQGYEMIDLNNFPAAINCYVVENAAGNCGYFFPGVDGIVLARSCTGPNDHTWAHEVGHFLSLPHPFYGWEGQNHDYDLPAPNDWDGYPVERMDGSNCNFAADGFCDTAPDYLNYRWNCNSSGTSNVVQSDPNGETFVSDGSLFMSYSNPSCKGTFSNDQIAAMQANVVEERPELFTIPPDAGSVEIADIEEFTVITPQEGVPAEGAGVTLSWEPIPNATRYIVQLNPFNFFSVVLNEYTVEGTSLEVTGLLSDRSYYWRIRPLNDYYTCTDYTDAASFTTGTITSTDELVEDESLRLFPNPVTEGRVQLRFRSATGKIATWHLSDARGARLRGGTFTTQPGQTDHSLDLANLPAGVYFVRLQLADRQVTRKLVVK